MRIVPVLWVLTLCLGCSKQAATLGIEPKDPIKVERHGKTIQLKAQTKDDRGVFMASVKPAWESKDVKVATVDANGLVSVVGSGKTEVVGTFENLTASVPISAHLLGPLVLSPAGPQKVKLGKYLKINVTVKDDQGVTLPDEKVVFKKEGDNIDVDPDGTVITQGPGDSVLIVQARDQTVRVKINVVD